MGGLYVGSLLGVAALSAYVSRNLTGSGPSNDVSARRPPGHRTGRLAIQLLRDQSRDGRR